MSDGATRLAGIITAIVTLACWSVTPLFIRSFAEHIDPYSSNGWRYGFAALLWAPYLIFALRRGRERPGLMRAALVPAAINAAAQVAFTWAHYKIDPGLLTFGLRSQMLFVAIGAYLMFPTERPIIRSPLFLLGVAIVLLGTAGTALLDDEAIRVEHRLGVFLALLAGAGFAGYGLAVRKYMQDRDSAIAFAAISQYTAAAMLVLMFLLGDDRGASVPSLLTGNQMFWLLFSAVIGIALGHVVFYAAINRLGVTVASGIIQLQPFGAAIGSFFIFQERLNAGQWVAGGLAVIGAMLMLLVQHRWAAQQRRAATA